MPKIWLVFFVPQWELELELEMSFSLERYSQFWMFQMLSMPQR